jgi:hypothetical protein
MRSNGVLIVNPGSVGLQAYSASRPTPHVVETGTVDARYAILERRNQDWVVQLVSVPYDFMTAAALAEQRGAHAWAHALRTGRALPPSA